VGRSASYSRKTNVLAVGYDKSTIHTFDATTLEPLTVYTVPAGVFDKRATARSDDSFFSPFAGSVRRTFFDSERMLVASSSKSIYDVNMKTGEVTRTLSKHTDYGAVKAFSYFWRFCF
jgi:WD40 repeat protein